MIGRLTQRKQKTHEQSSQPKGFDDYELRLGDMMRGERATMGKSLLDVQRELRIKASYIAAIENADPTVFDPPGFIAGYVRSYARYRSLDPDAIHLPGIYVKRMIVGAPYDKKIEFRTVRQREAA